ncbi:MAG: hypothetical protein ABSA52_03075 [Candidatus Binatia bacterium]|jgi:hypothetical protein
MLKMTRIATVSAMVSLGAGMLMTGLATPARGLTTSDKPAAILVWPKVVVDTSGSLGAGPTETVIQLTNTNTAPALAHCFYVDANSHCAANAPNAGDVCQSSLQCPPGGPVYYSCVPSCSEEDFDVILTAGQPIGWSASAGLGASSLITKGTCTGLGTPCTIDAQCFNSTCDLSNTNLGTGIPPVPEDPFAGSLTCIEYTTGAAPALDVSSNTLKGEGTIESLVSGEPPQVEIYNAVGLQGTGTAPTDPSVLQLGGTSGAPGSYGACPTALILDHKFDSASSSTDLTLVPCGDNFLTRTFGNVTAQFVVYNEFEQRFSTSHAVPCFFESVISNIDTLYSSRSIFSQAVSGTEFGQTRIRGVGSAQTGRGLIGVARVANPELGGSGAYNLWEQGSPDFTTVNPDVITIP